MFRTYLAALLMLPAVLLAQSIPVTTAQYDNARTGANVSETVLTPQNVNSNQFGKRFALSVDGDVYAQPLYVPGVEIPGKGTHDVVFIATEHDTVYAFDAQGNPSAPLWQASFLTADGTISTVPGQDVECPFIKPEIGITSTPVIDLKTGTLYVLARSREYKATLRGYDYVQRLHALAITTGAEKMSSVVIDASVPGRGTGSAGGQIRFNPLRENPRAALLLVNGLVYLTWASSCDVGPYHGWVMAYDALTLEQKGALNVSPDAGEGGIWAGDSGPAADAAGSVFVATGNGKFDAASAGGRDYGDSVLKLALSNQGFALQDFFTPFNQQELNDNDADLGSGGPVLLPDQPGPHSHLLVLAGKGGVIYLLDRDRLGKYGPTTKAGPVQTITATADAYGAMAYWNQHLYFLCSRDHLRDFVVEHGQLILKAVAQGAKFSDPGATPTVSSNGSKNGIVWVIATKTWNGGDRAAVLHAYDAATLHEIYSSDENSGRDGAGKALRFTVPTVANGRVYIGAKGEVDVYGVSTPGR